MYIYIYIFFMYFFLYHHRLHVLSGKNEQLKTNPHRSFAVCFMCFLRPSWPIPVPSCPPVLQVPLEVEAKWPLRGLERLEDLDLGGPEGSEAQGGPRRSAAGHPKKERRFSIQGFSSCDLLGWKSSSCKSWMLQNDFDWKLLADAKSKPAIIRSLGDVCEGESKRMIPPSWKARVRSRLNLPIDCMSADDPIILVVWSHSLAYQVGARLHDHDGYNRFFCWP